MKTASASSRRLGRRLRAALAEVADPLRAVGMQAYMKSAMPYLGVPMPKLRVIFREVFASHPIEDAGEWRTDVLSLWHGAKYREERYGAIALSGHRKAKPFATLDALPMYEELIVTGAWWDYVDDIASHRVGPLLQAFPHKMGPIMLKWSRSSDLWKRRTSIICQLGFADATDRPLLYRCIQPSLSSKEFFLRKAIGWALRQLAWHDPGEVIRYVKAHEDELSPLSKREALKNLQPQLPKPRKPQKLVRG